MANNIKEKNSEKEVKNETEGVKDKKLAEQISKNTKGTKEIAKGKDFLPKNLKKNIPTSIFGNVFFYVILILTAYLIFSVAVQNNSGSTQKPLSDVLKLINQGKVQDITVSGNTISVLLKDGTKLETQKEDGISFDQTLTNNKIDITKVGGKFEVEHPITWDQILTPVLMIGLPLLLLFFILKQMKSAGSDIFSFAKSRARLFSKESSKITFNDVAGNEEAKRDMMEIVDFLKSPEKYRKLGARTPKGVLLIGPAGVGKTLLAKAIAGEANVPFFSAAGSEFMEMLVGVGSARVRDLFATAKANQPSIIFIDEIDAIGRHRGMGMGGGHDEREQTLNQILTEMDGFDTRTDVIVIAATNRADMLDPALVRAGRFDRRIAIPLPDLEDRKGIIQIHMRGKPFSQDVSIERVARKTVGFSGADIENMLNEAAILAARNAQKEITSADMDEAALKVTLGSERKTLQTEAERKITAYHEAGHAIVASNMPEMDPVNRISIVARGMSLGHTSFPPERDRYNETKTRLNSLISTMLGGRAAEEVVFNELTVGAADDIERATSLARKMVAEYGMSSVLGPVSYEGGEAGMMQKVFGEGPTYSEAMSAKIDAEVKSFVDASYSKAKQILVEKRELLDKVAAKLLEKETIDGEEYREISDQEGQPNNPGAKPDKIIKTEKLA